MLDASGSLVAGAEVAITDRYADDLDGPVVGTDASGHARIGRGGRVVGPGGAAVAGARLARALPPAPGTVLNKCPKLNKSG